MRTGVVIVVTNKQEKINNQTIENFLRENNDINICFVNNGCKDKTFTILEALKIKFPNKISIVNIKNNKGEDAALKVGFRYLLNKKNITKLNFSTKFNLNQIMRFSEFSTNYLVDI